MTSVRWRPACPYFEREELGQLDSYANGQSNNGSKQSVARPQRRRNKIAIPRPQKALSRRKRKRKRRRSYAMLRSMLPNISLIEAPLQITRPFP